jgi:hypothetical protein
MAETTIYVTVIVLLLIGVGVAMYFALMPQQDSVQRNYQCTNASSCTPSDPSGTVTCDPNLRNKDCTDVEGCAYNSGLEKIKKEEEFRRKQIIKRRALENFNRKMLTRRSEFFKPAVFNKPVKKERFTNRCSI